ncbi:ArsR/SmtB family transcription factor [Stackebrandtia nassauensis]|uniref:Transcriptional regulator, TrmB n=1 Tax=Stackebrandtia nassauensis (strain DSM 44728 / CIP 108903 / NRRL B-16338 / NBRC 102104 / LLR-40K-21) TaxID=446470 RepID=D3PUX9_STANL|nr:metalloregulator ArsR/SmtB family transcription factor [Stackebrandtia nassauensis]ADD45003.1 transcriptional regulator, TrmB [Stackebrandtia nassauensis DSM 44728]
MTQHFTTNAPVADTVACSHLDTVAKSFRALGDPTRLKLLEFILRGERTVAECVAHVGLSQPRVSVHLSCLADCGYVTARRDGRKYRYRVDDPRVVDLIAAAHALTADNATALNHCWRIDSGDPARREPR